MAALRPVRVDSSRIPPSRRGHPSGAARGTDAVGRAGRPPPWPRVQALRGSRAAIYLRMAPPVDRAGRLAVGGSPVPATGRLGGLDSPDPVPTAAPGGQQHAVAAGEGGRVPGVGLLCAVAQGATAERGLGRVLRPWLAGRRDLRRFCSLPGQRPLHRPPWSAQGPVRTGLAARCAAAAGQSGVGPTPLTIR